ncbi:MAG TPA: PBP1A family penicillin-binding protein [Candidatus Paceibacterota bacterium]|nr:PBP1A family penicillin-binding protein [Candidatus Paceibacterota bacterium]HPT17998.1 PBP1A family penicillin-binding protein [Candidatus Paceibacterota bacterium]
MIKRLKNKTSKHNRSLFLIGAGILIVGILIIWISSIRIPDFHSFEDRKVVSSTKIYDRTGEILLYDIHQDVKRTNIDFDAMGSNIKNATVAIEDAEFYNHSGIRVTSIIRAVISNALNLGKTQGGSTITQQLVKNTLLTSKKTIGRKFKEWILAIKIDNSMTKEKILEAYLNEAPYGGTIYGIEEASKTYFGKKAQDLTLAESAYLAAIPQSPTSLSPYGKNKDKLENRKNYVLLRMLENKFISQEDYNKAKTEIVTFLPQATANIKAPHFVFFIKNYLEEKYGVDLVENGGLKVTTTLDYNLEAKAEEFVKAGALENETKWNGSNASLVAIDPKTGQILTMVGSRDYFDKNIDGNFNVATAKRQPGSSFKPFIYATAFSKGFTPDTVLFDLPTEFQTTCSAYGKALAGHSQSSCYMPDNYDGKFRGPMTLRDALGQSINVIAVKLFYLAGLSDSLKTAEDMGISTLSDISRYGLTLVIGGGEVSLLDMTSAYGVFANNGQRNPYTGILKVETEKGKVLEEYKQNTREVLTKNVALTISDVLSDNVARTPTFGANSPLVIAGRDVAAKTGTTNNNKDAWTMGYTPSIVVGVWAGNNDNKPMKKGGSAVAGPIWNKFMNEALKTMPNEKFEEPNLYANPETVKPALRGFWQGNDNFFIDKISGKLATAFTPKETKQEKVITNVHTILYWVNKKDILGPSPSNPSDDPQFNHWEIPIQNWWAQNSYKYAITTLASKPIGTDDIHTENSKPRISIVEPNTSTIYAENEKIQVQVQNFSSLPLQKIDIFINDTYIGTSKYPFIFSFIPSELNNLKDLNEIRIIAYDTAYNNTEIISNFRVK